jgi:hypothetical protein
MLKFILKLCPKIQFQIFLVILQVILRNKNNGYINCFKNDIF